MKRIKHGWCGPKIPNRGLKMLAFTTVKDRLCILKHNMEWFPCVSMDVHGFPWIPWNSMEIHGIPRPCISMEFNDLLWNSIESMEIHRGLFISFHFILSSFSDKSSLTVGCECSKKYRNLYHHLRKSRNSPGAQG